MTRIEVKDGNTEYYTFYEVLLSDGGAYRSPDGRIHLHWRTP